VLGRPFGHQVPICLEGRVINRIILKQKVGNLLNAAEYSPVTVSLQSTLSVISTGDIGHGMAIAIVITHACCTGGYILWRSP